MGLLNKKEKYTDTQKVYKPVLKEVYNECIQINYSGSV